MPICLRSLKQQFRQSLQLRTNFFCSTKSTKRENFYRFQCCFEMSTWYNNLEYLRPKVQKRCYMFFAVILEIKSVTPFLGKKKVSEENWWSLLNYIGNFNSCSSTYLTFNLLRCRGENNHSNTLLVHVASLYDIKCNLSWRICRDDSGCGDRERESFFFLRAENFNAVWKHAVWKVLL